MSFLNRLQSRLVEIKETVSHLRAEPELAQKRIEICNACPGLSNFHTCKKCGCYMPAKTNITSAKCPIGKW